MHKTVFVLALLAAISAVGGCATTDSRTASHRETATERAIRDQEDAFLTFVMMRQYDRVADLVASGQAKGFQARAFIENRFRMKANRFDVVMWDRTMIKITTLKAGPGMLSTVPVRVRVLAENKIKPVFVNLYWRKESGKWRINAYPNR